MQNKNPRPPIGGRGFEFIKLVEETRQYTNQIQVSDFIRFIPIPRATNSAQIKDLYLEKGMTIVKIASEVGLSKAAVLNRLHALGIRRDTLKDMVGDTPRPVASAPYGKRIVDGKLMDDRRELKISRLIVELRARQNLGWNEVVKHLNTNGFKTRQGLPWKTGMARVVFKRWDGKL